MTTPVSIPSSTKLRSYEALYYLNRSFEGTLLALDRLRGFQFVSIECLNAWRTKLECIRAQINEELIDKLQEYEHEESARFDELDRKSERQRSDPDDVFLAARRRKKEIQQQIRNLQQVLEQHGCKHAQRRR